MDQAAVIAVIQQRCAVSALRAHRLYHGITLDQLASELGVTHPSIIRWEQGVRFPRQDQIDHLCKTYSTGPVQLGLFTDYSTARTNLHDVGITTGDSQVQDGPMSPAQGGGTEAGEELDVKRRTLLAGIAAMPAIRTLEDVRRATEQTQAMRSVGRSSVEAWHAAGLEFGRRMLTDEPLPLLHDLGAEFTEIARHLPHRQPTAVQKELTHAAARFAALIAGTFCNLRHLPLARRWWTTADSLAVESQDARLRAWIHGEAAVYALYQDQPTEQVIGAARRARRHLRGASAEHIRAVAAEAQALAGGGRSPEAVDLVQRELEPLAEHLPQAVTEDTSIYGWPPFRTQFVRSYVYTLAGDLSIARTAQRDYARTVAAGHYGSATNLLLHESIARVREGDIGDGAALARATISALPSRQRIGSVLATAELTVRTTPETARTVPEVVDLTDLLRQEAHRTVGYPVSS